MIGKRVQFDEATWAAVNLLRQERRRSFAQLAAEAFADLLAKHGRPTELKEQLRESAGLTPKPPRGKAAAAGRAAAPKPRKRGTKAAASGLASKEENAS